MSSRRDYQSVYSTTFAPHAIALRVTFYSLLITPFAVSRTAHGKILHSKTLETPLV